MKQITLKIEAGKTEEIGVVGDYVRIKSASVPVRIRDENSDTDASIEVGDALNLKPFQRLRVSHSDAGEQTITLLIGNGTSADSSKVGGAIDVASFKNTVSPVQSGPLVLTASTAVLAANAGRRFLFLQNNDAAVSISFNIAGGVAVLNQGVTLRPGASFVMDVAVSGAAINAVASSPTAALAVIEG